MLTILGSLAAATLAGNAIDTGTPAMSGGKLDLLPLGHYVCSVPGDAAGPASIALPGRAFTIRNGSTYRTDQGAGTYLLAGDWVTFTRGPVKGERFVRVGAGKLRWIRPDGTLSRVRCLRRPGRE
ncbi:MAG: elongation factor P [Pontixanthobacter sp.]